MAIDLRRAEEADADPSALQPVGEHLRHGDDGVRGLGELPVADRQRQPGRLRADRAALVDEHAAGCVRRRARFAARLGRPIPTKQTVSLSSRRAASTAIISSGRRSRSRHARAPPRLEAGVVLATSAVSRTCRSHPRAEAVAVAADRVPRDVEVVVALVVAVRVRRMRAARSSATASTTQPGSTTPPGRGSSSSTISSTVTIERARREHDLLLHAEDPPELDVAVPVGLLRVDDADVRPQRRHGRELLAGERARRSAPHACAPAGRHPRSRAGRRTAGSTRRPRTPRPCRRANAPRARAAAASRARPRRGTGGASRRPGCRPTRRRACARSPCRSAGRRRRPASSARASGRAGPGGSARGRPHAGSGA